MRLSGYELVGSVIKNNGQWWKVTGWTGQDQYLATYWMPELSPGTRAIYIITI